MFGWRKMRSVFMSDEELGKKNDDHKSVKMASQRRSMSWQPARVPPRRSLKRISLVFVIAALVYFFVQNIPVLGPDERMRRPIYPPSKNRPPSHHSSLPPEHVMHPPDPAAQVQAQVQAQTKPQTKTHTPIVNTIERKFNGPLKFHKLAESLQAISNTRGSQSVNRNILFAAASLKSAATLLPIACQMGMGLQNFAHFALLGRSSIDMERLWDINGIDKSCAIIFHDARPDYAAISTEERLQTAVFRGFHHINNYVHPQAILVDGSDEEEVFFTRGVRQHVQVSKTTIIELPKKGGKALDWITKVDSAALRMWDKIKIDILIQAIPGSSGSLIRLLRSLANADYTSSAIPHITIELPRHIDTATKNFLDSFAWPPSHVHNPTKSGFLSLRHRMPQQRITEEESATRFLESFWPAQPQQSHVLVLSPYAEVGPQFFHYLKYLLFEYRYSGTAEYRHWDRHLFGISLEQPLITLDGKKSFSPPLFQHPGEVDGQSGGASNPFLWQAPTSNAVLFLGEKWMELHDFVSRTMQVKEKLDVIPAIVTEKAVSKQHPSWLEHALRLARVRGYWFLYPGNEVAEHLGTVHNELYRVPEEYAGGQGSKVSLLEDSSGREIERIRQKVRSASEIQLSPLSLVESLPDSGTLWPLSALPIAVWDGAQVDFREFRTRANDFELEFREKVGGCDVESGKGLKAYEPTLAQDLFCNVS